MDNGSHRTAIKRKTLSTPTRYLLEKGLLQGRLLDYGCGRGFDCDFLKCDGYDPHYRPQPLTVKYDTIFCNYVLNVLPTEEERSEVLDQIALLLVEGGQAYIAVRSDKKSLNGWTSRGTFQTFVDLDLPVVVKASAYLIYSLA